MPSTIIRKGGRHIEPVAFSYLAKREIRIEQHPFDPLRPMFTQPLRNRDAKFLLEPLAKGGSGHATGPGQLFAGRVPRHLMLQGLQPFPEFERSEIREQAPESPEILVRKKSRIRILPGSRPVMPIFAEPGAHHQVIQEIQVGIPLIVVHRRYDSDTGQYPIAGCGCGNSADRYQYGIRKPDYRNKRPPADIIWSLHVVVPEAAYYRVGFGQPASVRPQQALPTGQAPSRYRDALY